MSPLKSGLPAAFSRLLPALAAFWRDCVEQWLALCPAPLRQRLAPSLAVVTATRGAAGLALDVPADARGRAVMVRLPAQDVLHWRMRLPRQAEGRLREAVGYRLLRDSALALPGMLFDIDGAVAADPAAEQIDVQLALCRREDVAELLALAHQQDLQVAQVGAVGIRQGQPDWVFHRAVTAGGRAARLQRRLALLALAGLVVVPLALGAFARHQQAQLRDELAALQRSSQGQAASLAAHAQQQALLKELDAAQPRLAFSGVLDEVARLLPAEAWLEQVEFTPAQLQLSGQAVDPGRAQAALRAAPVLSGLRLDAVTAAAVPAEPPRYVMSASWSREAVR
jgi:hypothetical protein